MHPARQSIFEYAPDSHGAEDYRAIVAGILAAIAPRAPKGSKASRAEVA